VPRNRRSKNNAPATTLDAPSSSFLENFHRDAVWRDDRLFFRGRVVATIMPDQKWPGMWRVRLPNGHLSDAVNLARAKDAAFTLVYAANSGAVSSSVSETLPKRR